MPGPIPQAFVDELIARADIVELIGRRVRLKRQGREFAGLCPFHTEKTPSFTVSPQKQFFHCFGCGAHGTAIGFLMRYEHLGFPEAVEQLADDLGVAVPRDRGATANPHAELYEVLARAQRFYVGELGRSGRARDYLARRGLSGAAETYGVGYAPASGKNLLAALDKGGVERRLAVAAGLLASNERGPYDRFRDRLMLPIRDSRGRTVGFGGRTLADAHAKYLNSPESPVFHKGRLLYGLYEARQRERRLEQIVVVEGYLDVMSLSTSGFGAAVATLGTAVTEMQAEQLFRSGAAEVVFCFDGDTAGERAAWRALERTLPALAPGRSARFAFLPEGEDPDSLVQGAGIDAFREVIAQARPLSSFLFETLAKDGMEGAERRAHFAGRLMPLIGRVRDPVFRETLMAEAAERVGLPLERLSRLLSAERSPRSVRSTRPAAAGPSETNPSWDPRLERALALVLAAPEECASVLPAPESLELGLPGADLLREIVETLRGNPHLTSASLLERFRAHPAALRLGKLPERYRDSIWQLAIDGYGPQLAAEFAETLAHLGQAAAADAELERLQRVLDAGEELDRAARERLVALLAKRRGQGAA